MFKKILKLAICVVTIAASAIPSHASEDTEWKIDVLRGLGIYQENPVTYDNFINSLAGLLYENPSEIGDAQTIARNTGMLESNEVYSGKSALTIGEACKLAVITLGYKPVIGTDGNYMQKAAELGITDGISANGSDRLKQDAAVEILYNMIDAAPLVRTFGGQHGMQYEVAYNENLLYVNRNIYEVKGILTGTDITSIYGEEYTANTDSIIIDGVSYFAGDAGFDSFLGKNVKAYIRESRTGDDEVVYVSEVQGKNETLIIDCDDIEDIGERISYITYYKTQDKTKKLNISASPRVIYNGMFLEDYVEDDFCHGILELIDNNGDSKYDIIKVSAYKTMVVEAIDNYDKVIKNRYKFTDCITELKLDSMENDIICKIYDSTGGEVEFSAIKTDDVLSVAMSRDEKLIDIYISGNGDIKGAVTGIDDAEETLTINGEEYETSEDFAKFLTNTQKTVKIGKTNTFFIDYFGKIAYMKENADNGYNVLLRVYFDEIEDKCYAVHMDMDGDWYTSQVYEKAKVDGERQTSLAGTMDSIKDESPQVVLLDFNSKNQIINIDRAERYNTADSDFCKKPSMKYTYRSSDRYFHSGTEIVYLEEDAKVIVFPTDDIMDRDNWKIYGASSFFKGDVEYTIECFNPDEFKFTDLVTVEQSSEVTKAKASESLYVITGFEVKLIDDEPLPVIRGSVDGFMNLSFIGKKADMFDKYNIGDVVNFALDQNGKIEYIEKVFSLADFSPILGTVYDVTSIHAGTVLDINYDEGKLMLDCGNNTVFPFRLNRSMQIMVYNNKDKCESKPISSISRYDDILLRTSYGKVEEIICVKN